MAKKSFLNDYESNPAMQFISGADTIKQEQQPQPAAQTPTAQPKATAPAPDGYKLNPQYVEKRTKRVQLVLQPSLYELILAKSKAEGFKSLNDYCHQLFEATVKGE